MISIHKLIQRTAILWLLVWGVNPGLACAQADPPVSLEVTAPKTTLREGETVQLKVIATFTDGSTKDVTSTSMATTYLTSSLGRYVTVDANGLVTAVGTGGWIDRPELVFAVYEGVEGAIEVTIVKQDALHVTVPKTTLRVGEAVRLTFLQKLPEVKQRGQVAC